MIKIFNFLKRKPPREKESLEKALDLGLITKEEMLKLKLERAEEDLKDYLTKKKK